MYTTRASLAVGYSISSQSSGSFFDLSARAGSLSFSLSFFPGNNYSRDFLGSLKQLQEKEEEEERKTCAAARATQLMQRVRERS